MSTHRPTGVKPGSDRGLTPQVFEDRLLARAREAGVTLKPGEVNQLERYYQLLTRWNPTVNLTALPLRDCPAPTLDRLLIEPLLAADFVAKAAVSWIDLGSGGGSPAIPLKVVRPAARLTMVESRSRKAAFLREVVRTLELPDVSVLASRFEDLAGGVVAVGGVDLITVRALRIDELLVRLSASLLVPGGLFVLYDTEFGRSEPPPLPFKPIATRPLPGPNAVLRVWARV